MLDLMNIDTWHILLMTYFKDGGVTMDGKASTTNLQEACVGLQKKLMLNVFGIVFLVLTGTFGFKELL